MPSQSDELEKAPNNLNERITSSISNSIRLLLNRLEVDIDDPNILETSTEAFINYIELLGKFSSSVALAAGRTRINLVDIKRSVKSLDIKRYEQVFLDGELENMIKKKNDFGTSFSKALVPEICTHGTALWRDVFGDTGSKYKKSLDPELFEFVDSVPKHIPDFLPIFPPRLDYCDNKFNSS